MMPKSKLRLAVVVIVSLLLLLAMWTLSSTTYVPSLTILPLHVTEHNPDDDRPMDNMLDHKKRTFDALSTSLAGPKTNADAPQPTIPGTSMRWTPGGVVGASLQTVESELDRLFELFYVKYFFGQGGNITSSTWCHASRKAVESPIYPIDEVPQSWAVLEGAMKILQNITLQHNDDCRVHLALHHRAMCFIAAALDDGSGDDCSFATTTQTEKEKVQQQRGGFVPLHQRCAYRTSYCAQLMPCLSWTRGTIEVLPRLTMSAVRFDAQEGEGQGHERVSPGLLRHVYQSTISPRLKKPPPTGNSRLLLRNPDGAFVRHQKLFLHGDVACIDDSSMPLTTFSTTSETASRQTSCMNMADDSVLLPRLQEQEAYLNFTHELQASEYRRPLTRKNKKAQLMLLLDKSHTTNARKIDPTTAPPQSSVSSSNTALEQRIQINTPQPVCHLFHGTRVVAAAHTAAVSTTPSSIINRAHRSTLSDRGGDRSDDVADARRRASLDRGNDHPSSEEESQSSDDDSGLVNPFAYAPVDDELTISVDGSTLTYFTPLETLAALWHRCERREQQRDNHAKREEASKPCVILFHGDSLVRESFTRLILYLRYGIRGIIPSPLVGDRQSRQSFSYAPVHIEVGMFQDIVYRLFAAHDEVVLLENSESSRRHGRPQRPQGQEGRSTTSRDWTMREYMEELVALHQQQHKQKHNSGPEIMPLLHVVFCWDHESQKPRAAGYRRADVALELSKPKDGFEEEQRIEDDDDRQHQPSQLGRAFLTPTTIIEEFLQSDVSFSDYDERSSQGPLVNNALQILGVTFWQRTIRPQLLRLLHKSSTGHDDTPQPSSPSGRNLYIMMPLFHTPTYPVFSHTQPQLKRYRGCGLMNRSVGVAALKTCFPTRPKENRVSSSLLTDVPLLSLNETAATERLFSRRSRLTSSFVLDQPPRRKRKAKTCEHFNIAKTSQWFKWMREHLEHLRQEGSTKTRAAGRLFESVTLFDKGKAPFAGLPMGDNRHCSCHGRATTELNRRQFRRSTTAKPISGLLSSWFMDNDDHDINALIAREANISRGGGIVDPLVTIASQKTLCSGTVSAAALAEWYSSVADRYTDVIYRMQKLKDVPAYPGQGPVLNADAIIAIHSTLSTANNDRRPSMFVEIHKGMIVAGTSPPKQFTSFIGNGQHRCRNPGDLYFLQLILHDLMLRG